MKLKARKWNNSTWSEPVWELERDDETVGLLSAERINGLLVTYPVEPAYGRHITFLVEEYADARATRRAALALADTLKGWPK